MLEQLVVHMAVLELELGQILVQELEHTLLELDKQELELERNLE